MDTAGVSFFLSVSRDMIDFLAKIDSWFNSKFSWRVRPSTNIRTSTIIDVDESFRLKLASITLQRPRKIVENLDESWRSSTSFWYIIRAFPTIWKPLNLRKIRSPPAGTIRIITTVMPADAAENWRIFCYRCAHSWHDVRFIYLWSSFFGTSHGRQKLHEL